MKMISAFMLLGAILFFNSCDTETPEKAGIYYDNIVSKVNLLTGQYEGEMSDAIDTFVPEEMNKAYKSLESYVLSLEKEFNGLSDFYGDKDLLTSANAVIRDYKKALPMYANLVRNESISQDEYTDENEQIFNDLSEQINDLLNKSVTDFQAATYKFGEKHKITIVPSTKE